MSVPSQQPKISDHVRQRTREWFRKAEHELAYLAVAPFDSEDPPTDTTCKMAHMVAEYVLKAYLMLNKRKIHKSHDLLEILNECVAIHDDQDFEQLRPDCQVLTQYRVTLVYPLALPTYVSVREAKEAIEKAKRIMAFVLHKSKALGY
ncbi:MAG: HEPN domain-containing protein [Anaerolineales bacterium]|nr:HEPN domain-containing protein [Anaerolineales bacterium]